MSISFEEKASLRAWAPRKVEAESTRGRPDRWPTIAAVAAILIGASALIALRDSIMRMAPAENGGVVAPFAKLDKPQPSADR